MTPTFMLSYCALLLVADVFSQTPELSPSSHSAAVGQSVTFNCVNGIKDSDATAFLRQIPGESPKKILHNYDSYSGPVYGPGFSSDRFCSTINTAGTEYQLTVKNLEVSDTAFYYCVKWYTARAMYVFSKFSKLIVTVDNYPTPALNVFQPPNESDSSSGKPFLTCHASKLTVGLVNVNWQIDGTSVQQGVSTSQPVREADNSFSVSSYMEINPDDMKKDKVISCWIQQEGSSIFTSQGIKLSQC